jgi:hypothetical protein
MMLMMQIHLITNMGCYNFSLHTVPPKPFLQVLVHLGASGMNRIGSIMGLLQNELLQLLDARDAEAAIIP